MPEVISIDLCYRYLHDPAGVFSRQNLRTGEGKFFGLLPLRGKPLSYWLILRDRARNVSRFPQAGSFWPVPGRPSTLRVVARPTPENAFSGKAAEWPVSLLGEPGSQVVQAFRTVVRKAQDAENLEQESEKAAKTESRTWEEDVNDWNAGRLPAERFDLLLQDVCDGKIPAHRIRLNFPDGMIDATVLKQLRYAIQYRRLHDEGH